MPSRNLYHPVRQMTDRVGATGRYPEGDWWAHWDSNLGPGDRYCHQTMGMTSPVPSINHLPENIPVCIVFENCFTPVSPDTPWLATDGLLAQFGNRRVGARQRYQQFVTDGVLWFAPGDRQAGPSRKDATRRELTPGPPGPGITAMCFSSMVWVAPLKVTEIAHFLSRALHAVSV
jgi:hypothetical protein